MATAKQPDPPEKKRSSPTPSPEFVQARLRRDIRLLDERMQSLTETFNEKREKIANERQRLVVELKAVDGLLEKAGHAEANGPNGGE